MSVSLVIELANPKTADAVQAVLKSYQARLRANIERTQRRLARFEARYAISTDRFLAEMTAEDMEGGDLEYVEWAGEAKLLAGLQAELEELSNARVKLQ